MSVLLFVNGNIAEKHKYVQVLHSMYCCDQPQLFL